MIHKQPKKTDFEFVTKALSKDETRPHLSRVKVIDGKAYATDGHRAHWCETEIPDGLYDIDETKTHFILELAENQDERYPDILRVFPEKENKTSEQVESAKRKTDHHIFSVAFARIARNKAALCYKYLCDMLLHKDDKQFTVYIDKPNTTYDCVVSPIVFENCTCGGVIMPIRIND